MKRIVIAVPNTGQCVIELVKFFTTFKIPKGYKVRIATRKGYPLASNRNAIVKEFLKDLDNEWLLTFDSDIVPPRDILDMIKYNKGIVAPIVFAFQQGVAQPLIMKRVSRDNFMFTPAKELVYDEETGLIEADGTGAGCLLIRRDVLEKIKRPWFEFLTDKDGIAISGEDYQFCVKCQEKGYKILIDTTKEASHLTRLDIREIAHIESAMANLLPLSKWKK